MIATITQTRRRTACGALCLALLLSAGCETAGSRRGGPRAKSNQINAARVEQRDDIVQGVSFWNSYPWVKDGERFVGFKAATFFVSGETELGAFVPGTIFAWLYTLSVGPEGRLDKELAHVWEFDRDEAMGFRVRKRAITGYYYGFILIWPPELDLEGKRIEVVFGYERQDKRPVLSQARQLKVPVSFYRPRRLTPPEPAFDSARQRRGATDGLRLR